MGAELGDHLGYAAGQANPEPAANQRNGKSAKTVLTSEGPLRIEVPRDRDGNDILIAVPDGLKGMPEALGSVYPPPRCKRASCT